MCHNSTITTWRNVLLSIHRSSPLAVPVSIGHGFCISKIISNYLLFICFSSSSLACILKIMLGTAVEFALAILKQLKGSEAANKVAAAMQLYPGQEKL